MVAMEMRLKFTGKLRSSFDLVQMFLRWYSYDFDSFIFLGDHRMPQPQWDNSLARRLMLIHQGEEPASVVKDCLRTGDPDGGSLNVP